MLIIHLLLVGMLVSTGDPNKGPSQKQQTFPWIKYSHHQDLYTGKHCLLSQLPLISHYHDAYMTCMLESNVCMYVSVMLYYAELYYTVEHYRHYFPVYKSYRRRDRL